MRTCEGWLGANAIGRRNTPVIRRAMAELMHCAEMLLRDELAAVPVGNRQPAFGVTLSLPTFVGHVSVVTVLQPHQMSEGRRSMARWRLLAAWTWSLTMPESPSPAMPKIYPSRNGASS